MNPWDKFRDHVLKNNLIGPSDEILVCVSGGPDSVCLTHLLWRFKKTLTIGLKLIYCDHGLRKESVKEAEFVRRFGSKLGIPVFVKPVNVRSFAHDKKLSLETAGRGLRYETFIETAEEEKCSLIATGHNANDNAETMLMWLVRGTGSGGMCGIPVLRGTETKKIKIIRPLLCLTRKEIDAYLKNQKLHFCIDKSNFSFDFTRNRYRHELVPALEKYNPCFVEHMYNLSQIFAKENDFLNKLTENAKRLVVSIKKQNITLDLKGFFRYNEALRFRLIKSIIPEKKSQFHIERIYDWILNNKSGSMDFSSGWKLIKNSGKVVFKKVRP